MVQMLIGGEPVVSVAGARLAFSTDSYVVKPLFFPGGDIGDLAVNGTVNDLAMAGLGSRRHQFVAGRKQGDLRPAVHGQERVVHGGRKRNCGGDRDPGGRGAAQHLCRTALRLVHSAPALA